MPDVSPKALGQFKGFEEASSFNRTRRETMATETLDKLDLKQTIADLGLTIESTFVPFSQSRNRDEKMTSYLGKPNNEPRLSLNWRVRMVRNGRTLLETDYSAGCGHCPSYKQGDETLRRAELIAFECENGYPAGWYASGNVPVRRNNKPLTPDPLNVIHSLVTDSDVLEHSSFEEWAESFGYDADSRKAEEIYRQCLNIAIKLRNGIGEDGLAKLREASQDY